MNGGVKYKDDNNKNNNQKKRERERERERERDREREYPGRLEPLGLLVLQEVQVLLEGAIHLTG
jgi:hypothetical protein